MSCDSLLIYTYGGPESMAEVPDFIRNITKGRVTPERLAEVSSHYAMFNGVSPMNGAVREFMRLWKADYPEIPVYFGARFTKPELEEAVRKMISEGRKNVLVLIPAPFVGYQTAYHEKLAEVCARLDSCPNLTFIPPFSTDSLFLTAQERVISETLSGTMLPASFQESDEAGSSVPVTFGSSAPATVLLFSVHSLPVSLARGGGYESAVQTAFEAVKSRFPQFESFLGWQSAASGPIPWLEPKTTDVVREIAAQFGPGSRLLLIPFGFPFENMEVAYDLDTESRNLAESLGLKVFRVPTIGLREEFREMIYNHFI